MIPYNLQLNLKLPPGQTGMFMAIGSIACFLFSPLANLVMRKFVCRLGIFAFYVIYFILDLINSFQVTFFPQL